MFGDILKNLRQKTGETQDNIANLCNVHFATVSSWERGQAEPSYDNLKKIAYHFNVTLDYLLGFTQEDYDKIRRLEQALKENGITNIEQAMKIIDALKGTEK